MNLKELVKMFVDETPLTEAEIDELLNYYLIERLATSANFYGKIVFAPNLIQIDVILVTY